PIPVLDKDLLEDVPVLRGRCNHEGAPSWGMGMCTVQLFYHVSSASSTPSSAFTEARSPPSLTLEAGELQASHKMRIPIRSREPDGGLARDPMDQGSSACLPPPKANLPSHATRRCQDSTSTPKPVEQVLVRSALRGTSGHPRQSGKTHGGHCWGEVGATTSAITASQRAHAC